MRGIWSMRGNLEHARHTWNMRDTWNMRGISWSVRGTWNARGTWNGPADAAFVNNIFTTEPSERTEIL